MGNEGISHDARGQSYQPNYDLSATVPKNLRGKVSQGEALTDKELMHLHLKEKGHSKLMRLVKILLASEDTRKEWATQGNSRYTKIQSASSSSSASETTSETESFASKHFKTLPDKQEDQTVKTQTEDALAIQMCLESNKSLLGKIFSGIELNKLAPAQEKALIRLLDRIDDEKDLAAYNLFIEVIQHMSAGKIPASTKEIDAFYSGFQKLNTYRQETNPLVFEASNWKGQLGQTGVIDDAFISTLKAGWSNCLNQIFSRQCTQAEKLEAFILNILTDDEKAGLTPFNPKGEKEQMLMMLLSASDEFPDFLDRLIARLDTQSKTVQDQFAETFLSRAQFVQKLTQEMREEAGKHIVDKYKEQFDPSLGALIDSFIRARFPDAPPKQSELPDAQSLPDMLLVFKIEMDSHPLAFDAVNDQEECNVFCEAFGKFLPDDPKRISLEQLTALSEMAKLASKLIHEHEYDLKEVVNGCVKYFTSQKFNKQILSPPENAQKLNSYLLPVLSPKKDWQSVLHNDTAHLSQELVQKLVLSLNNQGLQPRNLQEISALTALAATGSSVHTSLNYPPAAVALGIADYLAAQRLQKEAFSPPLIEPEKSLIPFCYQHLTAIEGWSGKLESNIPAGAQTFCRALIAQMNADPKLVAPVNNEELIALEKLVLLGAEIASDKSNAYDNISIATGCAAYLKRMRNERKSFTEMTSLGGLITHVTKTDLYPFCFAGLTRQLLKHHPDREKIVELLNRSIGGKGVPLSAQGRERLEFLIKGITSKEFAQGKGIHHFAAAAKLSTILHDLRLRSVAEFNDSDNSPHEVLEFFHYCQYEQFEKLANASEVIAEITKNPDTSVQRLFHGLASALMGKNSKDLAGVSKNFNELTNDLFNSDSEGLFTVIKRQLDKYSKQLNLTEGASVNVSINTLSLTHVLQGDAKKIQAAHQKNQKVFCALQNLKKAFEKERTVKEYLELQTKIAKKGDKNSEKNVARYNVLAQSPQVILYNEFIKLKEKASHEQFPAQSASFLQAFQAFSAKVPQQFSHDLTALAQELAQPGNINGNDIDSQGSLGELLKQGINALTAIQIERNNGTYTSEDALKETAEALKVLENSFISKLATGAVLFSPKATQKAIALGLKIGLSMQIKKLEKEMKNAERAQRFEDMENLALQLKFMQSLLNNQENIAKALTPVALTLLKNHKLHKHQDTIKTFRKLLEHPSYVLTENDKAMLAGQLATSASVLLAEVEKNYPRLLETLTDTIFNLPKQDQEAKAARPFPSAAAAKPMTPEQQEHAVKAMETLTAAFLEEFPLQEEDAARTAARKNTEEATKAQEKPTTDLLGSLWGQFTRAVESTVQEISDSAKSTFSDYQRNNAVRGIFQHLQKELKNHPYLIHHFDEGQKGEMLRLAKEAAKLQTTSAYSPEAIAIACRLFIENEANEEGKLDIPLIAIPPQENTEQKLLRHCFAASIESVVSQTWLPADPTLVKRVAKLIGQSLDPSQEPLTETGQNNIRALAKVMMHPDFAGGKPLGLPIVTNYSHLCFRTIGILSQHSIKRKFRPKSWTRSCTEANS